MGFFYVYVLESLREPGKRYVGRTQDLRRRLEDHNSGKSPHTSRFRPWRVGSYVGFREEGKARRFERYLKQGSGHAFLRKHF